MKYFLHDSNGDLSMTRLVALICACLGVFVTVYCAITKSINQDSVALVAFLFGIAGGSMVGKSFAEKEIK